MGNLRKFTRIRLTGLVASLAPLVSPYGLPVAGLMLLVRRTSTPAGHRLALCLSPTAQQFPVPRAAIRAGGRRDKSAAAESSNRGSGRWVAAATKRPRTLVRRQIKGRIRVWPTDCLRVRHQSGLIQTSLLAFTPSRHYPKRMPKLYEYLGLDVFFYSNEHQPVHVHGKYQGR